MAGYKKGKAIQLTKNFKTTEFDCKCTRLTCTTTIVNYKLAKDLQKIRDHFKKPVIINSGYRCSKHNKEVGGAASSMHLSGAAADIVVKGIKPKAVAAYAESIGIKGIGLYDTFTHIDSRSKKAFWQGRKQLAISTFGIAKSNRVIAEEVINGLWGNGAARKRKLEAAGYNSKEIQALVNDLLRK